MTLYINRFLATCKLSSYQNLWQWSQSRYEVTFDCIHIWQYFLIFWSSCKQTASCCVWKFCSSKFMCLMTNIRKSWLCFKILWLSFLSFWCLQFLPKNEWKQVDLRYHSSKVEFVCAFFWSIVGLKKSLRLCLTLRIPSVFSRNIQVMSAAIITYCIRVQWWKINPFLPKHFLIANQSESSIWIDFYAMILKVRQSRCDFFQADISSKNEQMNLPSLLWYHRLTCFCSFFGRN